MLGVTTGDQTSKQPSPVSAVTADAPLVYIVMPNYNGYDDCVNAIRSFQRFTYPNFRILVVDDCSPDGSGERLRATLSGIEYVSTPINGGMSKAYNFGAREALKRNADFVLIMQSDTINHSSDYLDRVVARFGSDPAIGVVGSLVYDGDGKLRWDGSTKKRFGISIDVSEGFVVKRAVYEAIGFFDEGLKEYFEEIDFFSRMRRAGFQTSVVREISFVHLGGHSSSQREFRRNFYRVRNTIFMLRRYTLSTGLGTALGTLRAVVGEHLRRVPDCLSQRHYKRACGVVSGVALGLLAGAFLPWIKRVR